LPGKPKLIFSTLHSFLEMGRGVRELAGLMPDRDNAGDLIDATRRLMSAFGVFIEKVHPEHMEKRSNILNAASHVGETTHDVINVMREETAEDRQFHDKLIKRAKDVATNTASLVMHAKTISSDCTEPALREQVSFWIFWLVYLTFSDHS
jgi:talin